MGVNQIYQWAVTADANTMSDATYQVAIASGGALVKGVVVGQASSAQANKTWRQALTPASGLSQFIADTLNVTVTDLDSPATFSARITQAIATVADENCLQLNSTTTQTVSGSVTFGGLVLVPAVQNNFSTHQVADALTIKNNFVKQGFGFSNFNTNQLYLGWRTDGSGLGLGVDSTDVGTIALKSDVMPSQSVFGQVSQIYYTPTPSSTETTTHISQLTFTAPHDGCVLTIASFNVSNIQPSQCQGLIQIYGSSYQPTSGAQVWSDTTLFPMSGSGIMRVKKGDHITIVASYNVPPATGTFASIGQTLTYIFTPAGF